MPPTTSPEAQKRVEEFYKEYGKLVEKYQVDFASYPLWVPSGQGDGSFKCVVQSVPVDIANTPRKSPPDFIPK